MIYWKVESCIPFSERPVIEKHICFSVLSVDVTSVFAKFQFKGQYPLEICMNECGITFGHRSEMLLRTESVIGSHTITVSSWSTDALGYQRIEVKLWFLLSDFRYAYEYMKQKHGKTFTKTFNV